ncbi:hypothetical protein M0804_004671 [Polistes exclamans]|nr:hypothetical protein M0804_004671 [Polistes exclamans]
MSIIALSSKYQVRYGIIKTFDDDDDEENDDNNDDDDDDGVDEKTMMISSVKKYTKISDDLSNGYFHTKWSESFAVERVGSSKGKDRTLRRRGCGVPKEKKKKKKMMMMMKKMMKKKKKKKKNKKLSL